MRTIHEETGLSARNGEIDKLLRPHVEGKFIYASSKKLLVRGVTYGTFRCGKDGSDYDPNWVKKDFAQMAAHGFNAIRTYTLPPRWLLDLAGERGLYVMIGLAWEQHIAFLDERKTVKRIEATVRDGVRRCAEHPAVLCFAIGNEIPASIVRWHGHRRVERFLKDLYLEARSQSPGHLFTYVNYPSTEYLELPFLDLLCCNVYLESNERLKAYLARLQNLAADRPLVLGEVGLDSRRNGEGTQARVLEGQVRTAFAAGCAGAFVFSWTDEWHRGGYDVEDWNFGLTRADRRPKAALANVRHAFSEVPFPSNRAWPRVSVVVCTYNGSRTICDCCEGLKALQYPNLEVIIVNDGSTDGTEHLIRQYGFKVITTENRGLSSARNTGLEAATGEIVAYIDDDARPDPHWLSYLAHTFMNSTYAGVGGPNIAPSGDGLIADCVANAPGGPIHVLLSDVEAEHIPGCNMAFRRSTLLEIGGFDAKFRVAGDDVDICWRLQEKGYTLGFHHGASVIHHRRNSIRTFWRQQKGYGKAEALLEKKWPQKYNDAGHPTWAGRLYSKGLARYLLGRRGRIYQGTFGTAPFQSLDEPPPGILQFLVVMPEWYLLLGILAFTAILAFAFGPLVLSWPLLAVGTTATIIHAVLNAMRCTYPGAPRSRREMLKLRSVTALLHLMQPLARLIGRLRHGLTPWRRRSPFLANMPWPRSATLWSERWRPLDERLCVIEGLIRKTGLSVSRGGPYDRWDLEARGGLLGGTRALSAVEEHGGGKQLLRLRTRQVISNLGLTVGSLLVALLIVAARRPTPGIVIIVCLSSLFVFLSLIHECGTANAAVHEAFISHEAANGEESALAEHTVTFASNNNQPQNGSQKAAVSIRTAASSGQ